MSHLGHLPSGHTGNPVSKKSKISQLVYLDRQVLLMPESVFCSFKRKHE